MNCDSIRQFGRVAVLAFALALATAPAIARKAANFEGPVQAIVIKIIDGDTFLADALVWPGQTVRINIRIRGIDAPEMKSRCQVEHEAALRARSVLGDMLAQGAVSISNIGGAKYYGRVLADVATANGEAVSSLMLERQLVRPYDGGKRRSWCD